MDKVLVAGFVVVGTLALAAAIGLVMAFPIMWTWNATMPGIFHLKEIGWTEAFCLNFLCSCLIKSTQTNNK